MNRHRRRETGGRRNTPSGMARSRISGCGCNPRASGPSSCRPAPVGGCARSPSGASPRWVSRGPAGRPSRPRARPGYRWKPSSLKTFDIYLRNRLTPHFGRVRLDAITHARARQWGELAEHVPDACANIVRNPRRPVGPYLDVNLEQRQPFDPLPSSSGSAWFSRVTVASVPSGHDAVRRCSLTPGGAPSGSRNRGLSSSVTPSTAMSCAWRRHSVRLRARPPPFSVLPVSAPDPDSASAVATGS